MTYSIQAHRRAELEHDIHLAVDGGPAWQPYVLDKAERLVREDPLVHAGLVAAIESRIGPQATKAARRALVAFKR